MRRSSSSIERISLVARVEVVVDGDVRGQIMAFSELRRGCSKGVWPRAPRCHHGLSGAPPGAPSRVAGSEDQGVGMGAANLLRACTSISSSTSSPLGGVGKRGAVEVAVKLGPLEELVVVDGVFESLSIDEDVLRTLLRRATWPRRPAATQPEAIVPLRPAVGRPYPLPTPPGPMRTNMSGSAHKGSKQFCSLLGPRPRIRRVLAIEARA